MDTKTIVILLIKKKLHEMSERDQFRVTVDGLFSLFFGRALPL
jgi:hypothetical protein